MPPEPDDPSDRVIFQRIRNRTIEALEVLADVPAGVGREGTVEWINGFFDWVDDRSPRWRDNTAMTTAEVKAVADVHDLLVACCDATNGIYDEDEFIATGWPARVQPVARSAADLMLARGRFDEDVEQLEPPTTG
ncbi:MAG TPA: hypothetical protein VGH43_09640 [Jatrophihabitans sp.]|jgi:hypothetical protein